MGRALSSQMVAMLRRVRRVETARARAGRGVLPAVVEAQECTSFSTGAVARAGAEAARAEWAPPAVLVARRPRYGSADWAI